jgi:hypothetical protein
MKARRATPQYLLLHGNMLLSSSLNSGKIFSTLTSDSWGISISLKDVGELTATNDKEI